ncbi:hypothetical protein BU17DRAFT_78818 [Hysterangium stoloniferum]|nr:hypothetical protein BU17DRAFT_78818 [Hysterangium stoloniferum]
MEPRLINIVRLALLGALLFQCFVVLGLAGHGLSLFPSGATTPDFLGLDVAVPVLTLVIIVPCIAIDFCKKGAVTSMVAVELGWSGFLMILWLAAAADTTSVLSGVDCSFRGRFVFGVSRFLRGFCHEQQALLAFTWLAWLTILAWFALLLMFTVISYSRGNVDICKQRVVGTDFYASRINEQPQTEKEGPSPHTNNNHPYTGQASPTSYPPVGYNATPPQQV